MASRKGVPAMEDLSLDGEFSDEGDFSDFSAHSSDDDIMAPPPPAGQPVRPVRPQGPPRPGGVPSSGSMPRPGGPRPGSKPRPGGPPMQPGMLPPARAGPQGGPLSRLSQGSQQGPSASSPRMRGPPPPRPYRPVGPPDDFEDDDEEDDEPPARGPPRSIPQQVRPPSSQNVPQAARASPKHPKQAPSQAAEGRRPPQSVAQGGPPPRPVRIDGPPEEAIMRRPPPSEDPSASLRPKASPRRTPKASPRRAPPAEQASPAIDAVPEASSAPEKALAIVAVDTSEPATDEAWYLKYTKMLKNISMRRRRGTDDSSLAIIVAPTPDENSLTAEMKIALNAHERLMRKGKRYYDSIAHRKLASMAIVIKTAERGWPLEPYQEVAYNINIGKKKPYTFVTANYKESVDYLMEYHEILANYIKTLRRHMEVLKEVSRKPKHQLRATTYLTEAGIMRGELEVALSWFSDHPHDEYAISPTTLLPLKSSEEIEEEVEKYKAMVQKIKEGLARMHQMAYDYNRLD